MKPGFFIDRPIFSAVLSIVIVLVGVIGLFLLPVDQYPQITPPVVKYPRPTREPAPLPFHRRWPLPSNRN